MQAKSGSLYGKRHANSRCAGLPRKVSGPQRDRFCRVLHCACQKKKKKIQKKEDVYSEKLPEWGRGGKMLDPSCGRVRPEDRKKTSDFVSS